MAGRAERATCGAAGGNSSCACVAALSFAAALLSGTALLLGTGCANPEGGARRPPPDRFPQAQNRCIPKRTISSWRSLDAYRLKVFADREYVVELLGRCSSLITSEDVVFDSRDSQICDYRNDEIRTERESCVIGSIRTAEEAESESTPRQ